MSGSRQPDRIARLLAWSPLLLVGLAVTASVLALPHLPERVPTHWGLDGRPTNAAPRGFAAFVLPGVMLHVWLLLGAIGWATMQTPEAGVISQRLMPGITAGTVALMLLLHLTLLANGLGWPISVPLVANLGIGALFAGIGYATRDVPHNPLIGLRTPTTLRDPRAWRHGNRVAGNWMIAAGGATMLAAPLPGAWPLIVMIGAPIVACTIGVVAARRAAQPEPQDG